MLKYLIVLSFFSWLDVVGVETILVNKVRIDGKIALQQDVNAYIIPCIDQNFLVVSPINKLLAKVQENGDILLKVRSDEDLDLLRVISLVDGTFLCIYRSVPSWNLFFEKRDAKLGIISKAVISLQDSGMMPVTADVSGRFFIYNRASFYDSESPERQVHHLLTDSNLNPVIDLFSHSEGGRLYKQTTAPDLEDFLLERVKGYFSQNYLLGFDGNGDLIQIDFKKMMLSRMDIESKLILSTTSLKLPAGGRPPFGEILSDLSKDIIKMLPTTRSIFNKEWMDGLVFQLENNPQPITSIHVWGILPLGTDHFGLVTHFDLANGSQECMVYKNEGHYIGMLRGKNSLFITRNGLQKMFVTGSSAITLNSTNPDFSEMLFYDLKF